MILKKIQLTLFFVFLLSIILLSGCNWKFFSTCCAPFPPLADNGFFLTFSSSPKKPIFMFNFNAVKNDNTLIQKKFFYDVSGTSPVLYKNFSFSGRYCEDVSFTDGEVFFSPFAFSNDDWVYKSVSVDCERPRTKHYFYNLWKGYEIPITAKYHIPLEGFDGDYSFPITFMSSEGNYIIWNFKDLYSFLNEVKAIDTRVSWKTQPDAINIYSKEYDNFALVKSDRDFKYVGLKWNKAYIGNFKFDCNTGSYEFLSPVTSLTLPFRDPYRVFYVDDSYYFVTSKHLYIDSDNDNKILIDFSDYVTKETLKVDKILVSNNYIWVLFGRDGLLKKILHILIKGEDNYIIKSFEIEYPDMCVSYFQSSTLDSKDRLYLLCNNDYGAYKDLSLGKDIESRYKWYGYSSFGSIVWRFADDGNSIKSEEVFTKGNIRSIMKENLK